MKKEVPQCVQAAADCGYLDLFTQVQDITGFTVPNQCVLAFFETRIGKSDPANMLQYEKDSIKMCFKKYAQDVVADVRAFDPKRGALLTSLLHKPNDAGIQALKADPFIAMLFTAKRMLEGRDELMPFAQDKPYLGPERETIFWFIHKGGEGDAKRLVTSPHARIEAQSRSILYLGLKEEMRGQLDGLGVPSPSSKPKPFEAPPSAPVPSFG